MNQFGNSFRLSIWGESHGESVGITIDGVPPGIPLSEADLEADLKRRRAGAAGTTPRRERDLPHILSGLYEGFTTGAPLTILFANENTQSKDYSSFTHHFRPSHADRVARVKYNGYNDPRGGGHFSARLTVALVAAGAVAKRILPTTVQFSTRLVSVGGEQDPTRFEEVIRAAQAEGDSVGGVVECCIDGVPTGWGEPLFDSVESIASHLLFSIPAVKGVEFGDGFAVADRRGSENNDPIIDAEGHTATNHAGGIDGGITNGNPIVVRVAFKPTPSIHREQQTFDTETGAIETLQIPGRHDACIALRGAVVVEAMMAIALAELVLRA
ncbi:MAG: chorismate synthase [Rikenellaceae bacterium]|nr:chorismate synthase [Rikenellaceae bacterium]